MNNYETKRLVDAVVDIATAMTKLAFEAQRTNDIADPPSKRQGR